MFIVLVRRCRFSRQAFKHAGRQQSTNATTHKQRSKSHRHHAAAGVCCAVPVWDCGAVARAGGRIGCACGRPCAPCSLSGRDWLLAVHVSHAPLASPQNAPGPNAFAGRTDHPAMRTAHVQLAHRASVLYFLPCNTVCVCMHGLDVIHTHTHMY